MKKALTISDLAPAKRSRTKKKRIGRGHGSGIGKTSGKGEKGQKARAGYSVPVGFEGGQMPQFRRTPKRGFTSPFKMSYKPVNLDLLNRFNDGDVVDPTALFSGGIIDGRKPVKILAKGKLERKLTVKAHAFSDAARQAIETAGGTALVLK